MAQLGDLGRFALFVKPASADGAPSAALADVGGHTEPTGLRARPDKVVVIRKGEVLGVCGGVVRRRTEIASNATLSPTDVLDINAALCIELSASGNITRFMRRTAHKRLASAQVEMGEEDGELVLTFRAMRDLHAWDEVICKFAAPSVEDAGVAARPFWSNACYDCVSNKRSRPATGDAHNAQIKAKAALMGAAIGALSTRGDAGASGSISRSVWCPPEDSEAARQRREARASLLRVQPAGCGRPSQAESSQPASKNGPTPLRPPETPPARPANAAAQLVRSLLAQSASAAPAASPALPTAANSPRTAPQAAALAQSLAVQPEAQGAFGLRSSCSDLGPLPPSWAFRLRRAAQEAVSPIRAPPRDGAAGAPMSGVALVLPALSILAQANNKAALLLQTLSSTDQLLLSRVCRRVTKMGLCISSLGVPQADAPQAVCSCETHALGDTSPFRSNCSSLPYLTAKSACHILRAAQVVWAEMPEQRRTAIGDERLLIGSMCMELVAMRLPHYRQAWAVIGDLAVEVLDAVMTSASDAVFLRLHTRAQSDEWMSQAMFSLVPLRTAVQALHQMIHAEMHHAHLSSVLSASVSEACARAVVPGLTGPALLGRPQLPAGLMHLPPELAHQQALLQATGAEVCFGRGYRGACVGFAQAICQALRLQPEEGWGRAVAAVCALKSGLLTSASAALAHFGSRLDEQRFVRLAAMITLSPQINALAVRMAELAPIDSLAPSAAATAALVNLARHEAKAAPPHGTSASAPSAEPSAGTPSPAPAAHGATAQANPPAAAVPAGAAGAQPAPKSAAVPDGAAALGTGCFSRAVAMAGRAVGAAGSALPNALRAAHAGRTATPRPAVACAGAVIATGAPPQDVRTGAGLCARAPSPLSVPPRPSLAEAHDRSFDDAALAAPPAGLAAAPPALQGAAAGSTPVVSAAPSPQLGATPSPAFALNRRVCAPYRLAAALVLDVVLESEAPLGSRCALWPVTATLPLEPNSPGCCVCGEELPFRPGERTDKRAEFIEHLGISSLLGSYNSHPLPPPPPPAGPCGVFVQELAIAMSRGELDLPGAVARLRERSGGAHNPKGFKYVCRY